MGGLVSQRTRIQTSFILKTERRKSWFRPDSGGNVYISFFLEPLFIGRHGQDVSCELNKGKLAPHSLPRRQGS